MPRFSFWNGFCNAVDRMAVSSGAVFGRMEMDRRGEREESGRLPADHASSLLRFREERGDAAGAVREGALDFCGVRGEGGDRGEAELLSMSRCCGGLHWTRLRYSKESMLQSHHTECRTAQWRRHLESTCSPLRKCSVARFRDGAKCASRAHVLRAGNEWPIRSFKSCYCLLCWESEKSPTNNRPQTSVK